MTRPTSSGKVSFLGTVRWSRLVVARSLNEGFGAPVPDAGVGFLGAEPLGAPVSDARVIERALAPVAHAGVVERFFAPVPDAGVALLEEMRYPSERAGRDAGNARGLGARRGDARLDGDLGHGGVGGDGEGHGVSGGEDTEVRAAGNVRVKKRKKPIAASAPRTRGARGAII